MDKYEYKVKLDQIEKLAAKKDYVTAAKIADGIDWRKVKSVTTLTMIADIYEESNRLEDCYELLNMVYDRSPIGRRVVYRLAEVATKMHDFEEAIELYKEFVRIAPHDLNKYILKYQIYRERGSSVEDQIVILEEYKSHEYDEKWAYELACLFEEAGQIDRCVEECDELILWFSEGEYVAKAMELKLKYQELTATQQEKYEHRFDYLENEPEEAVHLDEEPEAEEAVDEVSQEAESAEALSVEQEALTEEAITQVEPETEDTPKVSEINTGKYNTINLQEELAKGIQMFLDEEEEKTEEISDKTDTQEFIPVKETVTVVKEEVPEKEALSATADLQQEISKYAAEKTEQKMEDFLKTEEDGQISLAIGEENILEKQITGQMTIDEILRAWEEKKRQVRDQIENAEGQKQAVPFETGEITNLLQDFIPKTPKDVQEIIEEIEKEFPAEAELEPTEEAVAAEPEPADEAAAESVETVEEVSVSEEPETLEDDLPIDIDLAEVLEAALEEPKEKEVEETAAESEEVQDKEDEEAVGQNTASMLDAIERALAVQIAPLETSGKYLTEEQEKIFAYFTSVSGMKKQLLELLNEEHQYVRKEDSKEGNLIITGHPGNGKTTLAIDIVKAFQKQRREKGGKLAKVTGDGLNKKDPADVVKKLGGGALIIERAGSLKDDVVEKLSEAMEGTTGGLLVILEDDLKEINSLLGKHAGFAAKFTRSVDIPIFSNDELVAFGKSYAEEQEYYFDEMAVLALYDSIGVRQTADHVVNITEVKEFVDDAIAHAEKKSRGLFARLSKKRIDEYGNKLLLEEDFDY